MAATPNMLKYYPQIPHDQMLEPNVIRKAAVYLASSDSAGITGQSFNAKVWQEDIDDVQTILKVRNLGQ